MSYTTVKFLVSLERKCFIDHKHVDQSVCVFVDAVEKNSVTALFRRKHWRLERLPH